MEYQNITEQIIKCAYKVYNTLGFGYLESVYEKSIIIELKKTGLDVESQNPITVRYDNEIVGSFIADLFVDKKVIVELKSIKTLTKAHEVQLVNYLTATGIDVGLLINFGESKVEVKRKVRMLKK